MTDLEKQMEDIRKYSESFITGNSITIDEWNCDKAVSDHKGIVADIR